jgi:hypothetical protein
MEKADEGMDRRSETRKRFKNAEIIMTDIKIKHE